MGSSGSSGSGVKEYKKTLYFDPEASSSNVPGVYIHDSDLRRKIKDVCDINESIEQIKVYKNPLSSKQIIQTIAYHAFVVLETKGYWWSLEKNTEGVTIQRSLTLSFVKEKYKRKDRIQGKFCKLNLIIEAKGKGKIKELIDHIYYKNLLSNEYSVVSSNCKHFAKSIFDNFNNDCKKY